MTQQPGDVNDDHAQRKAGRRKRAEAARRPARADAQPTMTLRELAAAMSRRDLAPEDDAPPPAGAGPAPEETERADAQVLVLRAGLEDCLCHLVELYGPGMLDAFLTRRVNLSVRPLLASAGQTVDPAERERILRQAEAARRLLKEAVEAVRRDPTPPT